MDEATRRHWAGKVRTLRGRLTQAELAERASRGGVTVTARTIRDMERGRRVPHLEKLLAVLDALKVDYERRDPAIDADLEALMVLVANLVRRLPADQRVAWAEHVTADLVGAIRAAADSDILDEVGDLLQRVPPGESGESGPAHAGTM